MSDITCLSCGEIFSAQSMSGELRRACPICRTAIGQAAPSTEAPAPLPVKPKPSADSSEPITAELAKPESAAIESIEPAAATTQPLSTELPIPPSPPTILSTTQQAMMARVGNPDLPIPAPPDPQTGPRQEESNEQERRRKLVEDAEQKRRKLSPTRSGGTASLVWIILGGFAYSCWRGVQMFQAGPGSHTVALAGGLIGAVIGTLIAVIILASKKAR